MTVVTYKNQEAKNQSVLAPGLNQKYSLHKLLKCLCLLFLFLTGSPGNEQWEKLPHTETR